MNKSTQFAVFSAILLQFSVLMAMDKAPETQKVESKINVFTASFPKDGIFSSKELEEYKQSQWIIAKDLKINYIDDKCHFKSFDFKKYGFQPVADAVSKDLLSEEGMHNDEERNQATDNVSQALNAMLMDWGNQNGIGFDVVFMTGGCVKRNLSEGSSLAKNYSFAHIDFPEGSTEETIKAFGGEAVWQQLAPFEIIQVVNIWLPLNDEPNINTLGVMDKATLKNSRTVNTEAYFEREVKFKSVYLEENQPLENNWFAFRISKGDIIIFDSERTPHCAVDISGKALSNEPRRSIEYRGFFLKKRK